MSYCNLVCQCNVCNFSGADNTAADSHLKMVEKGIIDLLDYVLRKLLPEGYPDAWTGVSELLKLICDVAKFGMFFHSCCMCQG
jgi:hypothetical protein